MIILDKIVDKVFVLYNPQFETAFTGENLVLYQSDAKYSPNGVIAQIIEERPFVPGGMKESLLLESLAQTSSETATPDLTASRSELRNQKLLVAKIRLSAEVKKEKVTGVSYWNGWSPTPGCVVLKIADSEILRFIDLKGDSGRVAKIGKSKDGAEFQLNLYYLHGVTVLLGGRGTGKSHLGKKLGLDLIDQGRKIIVFDINDEWSAMQKNQDGTPSPYAGRILKIDPGVNVSFDLAYLGRQVFSHMMRIMRMEETSPSMQNLMNYWGELEEEGNLTLEALRAKVEEKAGEKMKEALLTRLDQLVASGLVAAKKGKTLEGIFSERGVSKGGLIVVNLKEKTALTLFVVVQLFISKLARILSDSGTEPLVLILEEAQSYLEASELTDIVTRLRHLGLHQIYITNTPRSLPSFLLGHVTNWFVFNLVNDQDIGYLSNSIPLDIESATIFLKMLPPRQTLVLINDRYQGQNKNYPMIVEVDEMPYQSAGATRELFTKP